jgi:hypothetical protein
MLIHRTLFFLAIALFLILPHVTLKVIWLLASEKTTGVFYLHGRGNALDQIRTTNSYIYFKHHKDTIWFSDIGNLKINEGDEVPVVYQKRNPSDAKVNTFMSIWGTTVFYSGVPLLILLVTAIHPGIIPYSSKLRLTIKKPFVQII